MQLLCIHFVWCLFPLFCDVQPEFSFCNLAQNSIITFWPSCRDTLIQRLAEAHKHYIRAHGVIIQSMQLMSFNERSLNISAIRPLEQPTNESWDDDLVVGFTGSRIVDDPTQSFYCVLHQPSLLIPKADVHCIGLYLGLLIHTKAPVTVFSQTSQVKQKSWRSEPD